MTEPHLSIARTWQLYGNRLRLHVDSHVLGGTPGNERGATWLTLSAHDEARPTRDEVFVTLPIKQLAAVAEAAGAFNEVMNKHERESAASDDLPSHL